MSGTGRGGRGYGLGLVGFGRIGRRIVERLGTGGFGLDLVGVLVRPGHAAATAATIGPERVCADLPDLLRRRPAVVVECASRTALAEIAGPVLTAGIDLVPLSLAALADPEVERRFMAAAAAGPGRLEIPAGAMGSIDIIAAAREDQLTRVVFRAAYPTSRWAGTPADAMLPADAKSLRTTFFRGSVRVAARHFPRHVNVSVGVALAGLGLDRTEAELIADPSLRQATFEVDGEAGPGPFTLVVRGRDAPLGADPIDYTTFSVLRLLRRRRTGVMI